MTKTTQTQDELLGHLKEQANFLERSAASYSNGCEDEAKRLAVVIRVLVHDTESSTSLLTSLGKKNIKFYDSSLKYDPNNLLSYSGLTTMRMSTSEGESYFARLDWGAPTGSQIRKIPFGIWWDRMFVIRDKDRKTFTRKALVLNVANTDGGAHVDPSLDESYADLSRFNSMGWKVFNRDVKDNFKNSPILPSIRQIAHEVIKTLKDEFPQLF
ncbi:MAG: hypothetical protein ACXABY_25020 [Candidatus Thorarchaeota archaeon]|jgi:hypothetical protein